MRRSKARAGVGLPALRGLLGVLGLLLAGSASAERSPTPHRVPDTLAQRVQACTPCHGESGVATAAGYHPRIAGKPAVYLENQLRHFRDGQRNHATMNHFVAHLSDAYMAEIAAHFASLDLPYPAPVRSPLSAAQRERGEQLVRHGDGQRQLPACISCHGTAMTGVLPATPGLLGLPRDYLTGQLGAWRTGLRRAAEPDCMKTVALRLSNEDLAAVAGYLAELPVTGSAKPATTAPQRPLPLRCGSAGP